jgi:pentatricopeptide repeat protein
MQQRRAIRPDVAHFNYLIYGYGKAGRWKRAVQLLRGMADRKHPVNVRLV